MTQESTEDPLDRILREARPVAPAGLVARLAAGVRDPEVRRRLFWAEIERGARSLLVVAAAAAVVAVGLATSAVLLVPDSSGSPDNARTASVVKSDEITLDQAAHLLVSTLAQEPGGRSVTPKALLALLCAVNLVVGAGVGVAIDRTCIPRKHDPRGGRGLARLFEKLDLDAQQQEQVKAILTSMKPRLKALHEESDANMRAILRPDQVTRLDDLRREWESHDPHEPRDKNK